MRRIRALDADVWRTINGAHVLIDGDSGEVKGGAGGKLNGRKLNPRAMAGGTAGGATMKAGETEHAMKHLSQVFATQGGTKPTAESPVKGGNPFNWGNVTNPGALENFTGEAETDFGHLTSEEESGNAKGEAHNIMVGALHGKNDRQSIGNAAEMLEKHYSEQGRGSTFTVQLPLALVDAATLAELSRHQVEKAVTSAALTGKRILLCEDQPLNVEITTRLLQRQGLVVESAADGQIGLDMFVAANPGYYDLILMDVRMPVLDGLAATQKIRALPRADAAKIPIVAMTANAYEQDVQACYDAGMDDYLQKPVDVKLLYGTMHKYLG